MQIINLFSEDKQKIRDVAHLLLEGFTEAWNDIDQCLHEVEECLIGFYTLTIISV
ncbi:hypothetical protein J14TS5_56860 [Paenibacillus lautus]|nr:hypothetical protein J14TS5_56860 [Paenibacillus lautus]